MAQNVKIAGALFPDVPYIEVPDQSDVYHSFVDSSDATATAGDIASQKTAYINGQKITGTATMADATVVGTELILTDGFPIQIEPSSSGITHLGSFPNRVVTLAETDYATWSPSTAVAQAIYYSDVGAGTFTATDIDNIEYLSRIRIYADIQYISSASTANGRFKKMMGENWYSITKKPSNKANFDSGTKDLIVKENMANTWVCEYYYYTWTQAYDLQYGFYPQNYTPVVGTGTSPTVTVRAPRIYVRCGSNYFSTTMAYYVDQQASTFTFKFDYYRVENGFQRTIIHDSLIDMWNNGI